MIPYSPYISLPNLCHYFFDTLPAKFITLQLLLANIPWSVYNTKGALCLLSSQKVLRAPSYLWVALY